MHFEVPPTKLDISPVFASGSRMRFALMSVSSATLVAAALNRVHISASFFFFLVRRLYMVCAPLICPRYHRSDGSENPSA
jgi:hypothetical protein